MAEVSEVSGNEFSCPCSIGNTQNDTLQSFIGNDYFCESSNPTHKIHYGMVKVVVLLSKLVVHLGLFYHGLTKFSTLPLQIILS